jgi:hypothetical protein
LEQEGEDGEESDTKMKLLICTSLKRVCTEGVAEGGLREHQPVKLKSVRRVWPGKCENAL